MERKLVTILFADALGLGPAATARRVWWLGREAR